MIELIKKIPTCFCLATLIFGLGVATAAQKGKPALTPDEAKAKQAYALGVQAYIWGYPMVVMQ